MKDELEQVILRWWHDEKLEVKDLSVAIRAWIKSKAEKLAKGHCLDCVCYKSRCAGWEKDKIACSEIQTINEFAKSLGVESRGEKMVNIVKDIVEKEKP